MTAIGERLREERLSRGLGIEQIAEQLKINPSMLSAIETGDLDRLPAGFFRRSFVRQYARALGLAGPEIEAEIQQIDIGESASSAHTGETAFRPEIERGPVAPARASRIGGNGPQPLGSLIAFLVIVAICTGLYALWERTRQPQTEPASIGQTAPVTRTPEKPQPAPAAPAPGPETAPAQPGAAATEPGQPSAQAPQQAVPEQPSPGQPVPPQGAPGQAAPPQVAPSQPATGAPVRVEFHAKAEVWMRIRAAGKLVFEGTLKPEEVRTFEGPEVTARIGRPGSLSVIWNGKAAPLARSDTAVTLEFTPETYRIVPPQPVEAPPADVP